MTAPAALCFSKLMYPEMEEVEVTKDKIQKITM
jgi:nucleoside permease NupC